MMLRQEVIADLVGGGDVGGGVYINKRIVCEYIYIQYGTK